MRTRQCQCRHACSHMAPALHTSHVQMRDYVSYCVTLLDFNYGACLHNVCAPGWQGLGRRRTARSFFLLHGKTFWQPQKGSIGEQTTRHKPEQTVHNTRPAAQAMSASVFQDEQPGVPLQSVQLHSCGVRLLRVLLVARVPLPCAVRRGAHTVVLLQPLRRPGQLGTNMPDATGQACRRHRAAPHPTTACGCALTSAPPSCRPSPPIHLTTRPTPPPPPPPTPPPPAHLPSHSATDLSSRSAQSSNLSSSSPIASKSSNSSFCSGMPYIWP